MVDASMAIHEMIEDHKASTKDFANAPLPESMWALIVEEKDKDMFEGLCFEEKDPQKSLKTSQVPLPEPQEGEALVAIMASALNYNTVWSAIFEPMATFEYLRKYAAMRRGNRKHVLPYHILGSDGAGVVLRVGPGVERWRPGDRVAISPAVIDSDFHDTQYDGMLDPGMRGWGFETNFGGLAQFSVVRQTQLLPKPEAYSWEEAASLALVSGTTYRMLVSERGARMRQGDNVLIWGATGGMGAMAVQYVLAGGGSPVGVVNNQAKARLLQEQGCKVIVRNQREHVFVRPDGELDAKNLAAFKKQLRGLLGGEDVDIAFEHVGRDTFPASLFALRRGGKLVTCGSTTGYNHIYDNRYLWMRLKSVIGSHSANYHEVWQANRLACQGRIRPALSRVTTLAEASQEVRLMHRNQHVGKVGVLCLAQEDGLGVRDPQLRQAIGEAKINIYREQEAFRQSLAS